MSGPTVPPEDRWVLHVDMDAFYASVEVKEQPGLRGRPVVVGGTGNRGVVASASYEARAFGIRSAMPVAQARRLCPHAVLLAPRFEVYNRHSQQLHEIFCAVTPLVEGIGLDEAFLDVSGCRPLFGPPAAIAAQLHRRVSEELALACSIGAGPSKLVAKLASKAAKPRAAMSGTVVGPTTVVVAPEQVLGFLWPLPVEALWGVGPATGERLHKLGVATVGELASLPEGAVIGALGRSAGRLAHSLAWGRDDRPVVADRAPKSIGHEETYPTDLVVRAELDRRLVIMADAVASRVREQGLVARTVVLKLRYGDFVTLTRSHTFTSPQSSGPSLWAAARAMLEGLELRDGVRLLGVSASGLLPARSAPGEQLQLDLAGPPAAGVVPGGGASWARASQAVDAVRARFGDGALRPATAIGTGGEMSRPGVRQVVDEG
jgi:DNA polymerase-4